MQSNKAKSVAVATLRKTSSRNARVACGFFVRRLRIKNARSGQLSLKIINRGLETHAVRSFVSTR